MATGKRGAQRNLDSQINYNLNIMFDLERSIKQWLKLFRKHRAFNHGSVREMELHLRDHIEDLISSGKSEREAFELAVKEFGEVPNVAKEEFQNQKRKTTILTILHTTMLNSYFKTSLRSLMKNPLSSFINVFGLTLAIGICVVVYAFVDFDLSVDDFHEHKNKVYLATFFANRDGDVKQYGQSPTPLGEMLREDFAQIEKVCRVEDQNVVLKYEDNVFHERVRYADPEFLQMLTFPMKWGAAGSLEDLNSIVLSETMSTKYFGDENPIGKDILMIFSEGNSKAFNIAGVAKAFPKAHAIHFDFLINFENLKTANPEFDLEDWKTLVSATLVEIENPADVAFVEQGMEKYKNLQNEAQKDWSVSSFTLEQLATLHDRSRNIRNDISYGTREEGWVVLSILAIFMLSIACFNYINIAIVSAAKRLKEIGVRKVIGANQRLVIVQFLSENIFVTLFALILGVILGATLFLPWFNQLFNEDFYIDPFNKTLWIFLASMLLITGVVSGMYPAFYISRFNAVTIFKGTVQFGKKNPLTKILLSFQLVLACILITNGVMLMQNVSYQADRSWGYNQKGAIYVSVPSGSAYEQLSAAMLQDPNVLSMAGSSHHLGRKIAATTVHLPDGQLEVNELAVDANYFNTMGVELSTGRLFNDHQLSDRQSVVVNETLINKLSSMSSTNYQDGIVEPIGQIFEIDSVRYQVVGVVKDFHFYDFNSEVLPTIFKVADQEGYRYLSLRVRSGAEKETYDALQKQWAVLFPETPFQGGHQEDVFADYFEYMDSGARFMGAFAIIAVLLAALGLYGLVTLNVSGRVREFSIRKILGAGIKNITESITKQYMVLTIVALIVGAPLSFILVKALLDTFFEYHMPMDYSGVAISMLILIFVLIATVSTQISKVSKTNPVEGLKVE